MNDPGANEGEIAWIGVDERDIPSKASGLVDYGLNTRFDNGQPTTRPGIALVPWLLTTGVTPFGDFHGAGLFEGEDGQEWILVAAGGNVYVMRPGMVAQEIPLPGGVTLSGRVRFRQAYNKVVMGRGFGLDPLEMPDLRAGFQAITQESSEAGNGTGTLPIPGHLYAEFTQDRLVICGDGDIGFVGDIGNYTRYATANAFRINTGSSDDLVRFVAYGRTSAVAFKRESVHLVENLVPDAVGDWSSASQFEITGAHGLAADDGVVKAGEDLFYISEKGVTSLRQTSEGNIRSVDLPLSDPMAKTWARVNKAHLAGAQIETWDNKLFVAVPLDRAEILGADLVGGGSYGFVGGLYFDRHPDTGVLMGYLAVSGLTAGATYRYTPATADDYGVRNGSEIIYGPCYFVAAGTSVYVYGANTETAGATVNEVEHQGVNTGILVYDFKTRAWAGLDYAPGVTEVAQFIKFHWEGRLVLGYVTPQGYFRIMGMGYQDIVIGSVVTPYADLMVIGLPGNGETVQVNSGDTITAYASSSFNEQGGADTWGVQYLNVARQNIWRDGSAFGGFDQDAGVLNSWSAPNTTPSQIPLGVRFTSTNGAAVSISTTGSWAFVDSHSGQEWMLQSIPVDIVFRLYKAGSVDWKKWRRVVLGLATWAAQWTLTSIGEGVGELREVQAQKSYDRTKNLTARAEDWDGSNANDDHETKNREDYSVILPPGGMNFGASGIRLDHFQAYSYDYQLPMTHGDSLQVRLQNAEGMIRVRHLALAAVLNDGQSTQKGAS